MDYLIEAYCNGSAILGSDSAAIVRNAKSMTKVKNRLKWFNPPARTNEIKVFSFTNLYDEKTHKHVLTIQK